MQTSKDGTLQLRRENSAGGEGLKKNFFFARSSKKAGGSGRRPQEGESVGGFLSVTVNGTQGGEFRETRKGKA